MCMSVTNMLTCSKSYPDICALIKKGNQDLNCDANLNHSGNKMAVSNHKQGGTVLP